MNSIEINPVNLRAFVIEDKANGLFTVALDGKGGPVISSTTYKDACEKFEIALDLANCVNNLITFKEAIREVNAEKAKNRVHPKVEFILMAAV